MDNAGEGVKDGIDNEALSVGSAQVLSRDRETGTVAARISWPRQISEIMSQAVAPTLSSIAYDDDQIDKSIGP